MNKRHVIALMVGIVLLVVPILSCVPKQTAAPVATDSLAKLSDLTTLETALSKEIDKKADKDDIPDSAGLSKSEVQKVVDDSLVGFIKKSELEDWLTDNGYKKSSSSNIGDNTPSPGSEQVATDDDLELYLTEINPSSDVLIFSDQQSLRMDFDVLNLDDSSSHRFEVTVYLYPSEVEKNYYIDAADIYSDVSLAVPTRIPAADYICTSDTDCNDPLIIKCSNGWVGKDGDITSFTLACVVHIKTGTSARFDYDYSIRQTD